MSLPSHSGSVEQPAYGAEQTILVPPRRPADGYALKRQVFTDTGFTTIWREEAKDWINWSGSWKDVETLGTFASPEEARDFMIARAEADRATAY